VPMTAHLIKAQLIVQLPDSGDIVGVRGARSFVSCQEVHSAIKLYGTNRITVLLNVSLNGKSIAMERD
jgi:hypothetical protein